MQRWLLPVNLLFLSLIIAMLALITADILAFRLGRVFPRSAPKAAAATSPQLPAEDLAAFAPILEKGLFGKATLGKLTPIATPAAGKGTPTAAPSDLTLLGTAQGSFRETFALIQKNNTKEERVFRLGDTVFDIGPLVAVRKEYAEILANGQKLKIMTPLAITTAASAPGNQPVPTGGLAAQVGAGSYVIDQRALNSALDNIGQAMTDARMLPSVKDGKVEGFRVSEVKPQGIFGTVGIRNGDVLLRVNDFPIDSPEKAIQSFATLKGQTRIKLDLVRDGQPTTFSYDIR
ncbi:MAG TPA: type II secretion system protein GspC [Geobacteraceae bacterium]